MHWAVSQMLKFGIHVIHDNAAVREVVYSESF